MAEGGFPNRNRADNALTIYRDAMRAYIAPILERKHGPNWFRSQVLNDDARERNPNSYARREQSLKRGTPAQNLIDLADIPFLIQENRDAFPDLDQSDTRRMHMIRDLRNEIHHADRIGDCAPEEAESLAGLCTLVVERCGLPDAVENIRHLSSDGPGGGSSEAELREQRERREWDKARLAGKRPEELTPLEQQRLDDIEWEEEWERRELAREEREQQEREQQEREQWEEQKEARKTARPQRERRLREWEQERSEREEIAQFGGDINGLRHWFNDDPSRRPRHASEHARLRTAEIDAEERSKIAAFGNDIDGLRRWFGADKGGRSKRHPDEYAALEQSEMAVLGDDIDGLRRWFDADEERRQRHPDEYAALERDEMAERGDDMEGLRRWFEADRERQLRHPDEYAALERSERSPFSRIFRRR